MTAAMDSASLREVRTRQRKFSAVVGALMLLLIGVCIRMRWIGWAVLLGLLGIALIATFLVPSLVLSKELRRRSQEERGRLAFGDGYDRLYAIVFAGLADIDPFRGMYEQAGRRDGKDYKEYYDYDARRIVSALSEIPAGGRSEEAVRGAMFRTLEDNAFGNRWGGVGKEERYTDLARRVSEILAGPA